MNRGTWNRLIRRMGRSAAEGGHATADALLDAVFTNREPEIERFEALTESPNNRVIILRGVSGSGKSWLLRRCRHVAVQHGRSVVLLDLSMSSTWTDLLTQAAIQLRATGVHLRSFDRLHRRHQEIVKQVSHELGSLQGLLHASRDDHGARPPSPDVQEEFAHVLQELLNADELRLYLRPEDSLTQAFLADVVEAERPPVFMFDSYSPAAPTDGNLASFAQSLAPPGLLTIATTSPLSALWASVGVTDIELQDFNPEEIATCAARYAAFAGSAALDNHELSAIVEIADGLPLAATTTVHVMRQRGSTSVASVEGAVMQGLTEQLLASATGETREIVVTAAGPRWLNTDLLARLIPQVAPESAFAQLQRLPFVRLLPDSSLALHHQVRFFAHEFVRHSAPSEFARNNEVCRRFHEERLVRPDVTEEERRRSALELSYHTFEANHTDGVDLLTRTVSDALQAADTSWAATLISEAEPRLTSQADRIWLHGWQGEIAYRRGSWDEAASALRNVVDTGLTTHPAYVPALITLGRMAYQRAELDTAAADYEEALADAARIDTPTRAYALEQLAKVHRMRGKLELALRTHEEGLRLAQRRGRYALASGLGSYGTTLLLSGELVAGASQLGRSVEESRTAGYKQFVCTGLRSQSIGLALLGDVSEAESAASESRQIARELGDRFNAAVASAALAHARLNGAHEVELASREVVDAIEELREVGGVSYDLGNALVYRAGVETSLSRFHEAEDALDQAGELFHHADFEYGLAVMNLARSHLRLAEGAADEAYKSARQAREIADRVGARFISQAGSVEALVAAAISEGADGGIERLVAELGLSTSVWRESLQGWGYHALAATVLRVELLAEVAREREKQLIVKIAVSVLTEAARHNATEFVYQAQTLHPVLRTIGALRDAADAWKTLPDGQELVEASCRRAPWEPTVDLGEIWLL